MKLGKYGGFIIFNGNIYRAEEIVNALLSQHITEIRTFNEFLVIGNYQIAPLRITEENIEQIMDMTCYGSLAYCCSLEKKCEIRDTVLSLLNITPEEYENIKRQTHKDFISLANQKLKNKILNAHKSTNVPVGKEIESPEYTQISTSQDEERRDSFWKEIKEEQNFPFGQLEQDLFDVKEENIDTTSSKIQNIKQSRKSSISRARGIKDKNRYVTNIQKNVKICKYCGATIPDYAKFCPACGHPITD